MMKPAFGRSFALLLKAALSAGSTNPMAGILIGCAASVVFNIFAEPLLFRAIGFLGPWSVGAVALR